MINRSNFNPFKVISPSCHWAFQFNTSNNQSEILASVFYNLEINVRTLIRITICHGCQSVRPDPHLSACTLLKWTNYRSTSDTLVRRGVISNLALVIGTCATLHSHWYTARFEPRFTVPVPIGSALYYIYCSQWLMVHCCICHLFITCCIFWSFCCHSFKVSSPTTTLI